MPQEFRYPLTRYCLRGGALTLPRAMVGLFPESGEIVALDTRSETEHTLSVLDPRTITGLGPLFKEHRLAANDELLIRPLEDGRFSFTPVKRDHKPDYSSREAIHSMLDELVAASVPVTEAEVRALYPGIPDDVALSDVLAADERFVQREGRWHNALNLAYPLEPAPVAALRRLNSRSSSEASRASDEVAGGGGNLGNDDSEELAYAAVGAPAGSTTSEAGAESAGTESAGAESQGAGVDANDPTGTLAGATGHERSVTDDYGVRHPAPQGGADDGTMRALDGAPVPAAGSQPYVQAGIWHQEPSGGAAAGATGGASEPGQGRASGTVLERRRPAAPQGSFEQVNGRGSGAALGAEGDGGDLDDGDLNDGASLEVTELANRLRAALTPVGFRLESVARGQLLLTADMGRKSYTVLMQLLTRNDRLDWADLLARRRATNVRYLAVIGDHRALLRLTNPAELARATMWSWQALDRLATLQRTVAFSPIELESHFERDGLFEKGLERFEAAVAERVAERGAVSELLSRLAVMRAPSVFLLEDLASELNVPRDRLLRRLELLSEAPFSLIAKVDQGEFVLRQRVADSLGNLASYATSLRERLPVKQVERLTGLAEPDLLTEDELDDQATDGL